MSLLALTLACGMFSYAAGNPADACYYKYDKLGRLVGVEYANAPERNEFYSYDNRGNILEKRIGAKTYTYSYDASNQLKSMASEDGVREYIYDEAGRLVEEKLNGETDVEYRYGYLDKVTEVIRNGKSVKYAYDGFGMLTEKRFEDGTIEKWVWDGLALVRRGSDIYVNEPHVSGGVPILTKTAEGVRYHENDYLGTTLWSTDTKGNLLSNYSESTVFGEGSLQASRSARFTGKPYDEDMQAYVFPFRNYNPAVARWISSDPSGYPDGVNNQFYACTPTSGIDPLGLKDYYIVCYDDGIGGSAMNSLGHMLSIGIDSNYNINSNPPVTNDNGDLVHSLNNGNDRLIVSQPNSFDSLKNLGKEGDSIFVAAHGDTTKYAPDGSYLLEDKNGKIMSQNELKNLNENIRDSYGCNPKDGNVKLLQYLQRWSTEL